MCALWFGHTSLNSNPQCDFCRVSDVLRSPCNLVFTCSTRHLSTPLALFSICYFDFLTSRHKVRGQQRCFKVLPPFTFRAGGKYKIPSISRTIGVSFDIADCHVQRLLHRSTSQLVTSGKPLTSPHYGSPHCTNRLSCCIAFWLKYSPGRCREPDRRLSNSLARHCGSTTSDRSSSANIAPPRRSLLEDPFATRR